MSENCPSYKVVFVGDSAVGKTSLIHHFLNLEPTTTSTLGAIARRVSINIGSSSIILNIWDTAGQENLRNLVPIYAKGSQGAVIVFDLTNQTSYEHVKQWYEYVIENIGDIAIWIAANKSDLPPVVDCDEAEHWAWDHNLPMLCTSARTGGNVTTIFESIARELEKRDREKHEIPCSVTPPPEGISLSSTGTTTKHRRFCQI
jgi:small GTP-binding protein